MNRHKPVLNILMGALIFLQAGAAHANACISQGNYVNAALTQMRVVLGEIDKLKNQPECKVLADTVKVFNDQFPVGALEDKGTSSFVKSTSELSALFDFLKPSRTGTPMSSEEFRTVVLETMMKKSASGLGVAYGGKNSSTMDEAARALNEKRLSQVSDQLSDLSRKTSNAMNYSMNAGAALLNAINTSTLCLDRNNSVATAIFGALAHMMAAMFMGNPNQVNEQKTFIKPENGSGAGGFIGALMDFSRTRPYILSQKNLMTAEFRNSISCLVESSAESYCGVQDAEDALDFMKQDINSQYYKAERSVVTASHKDPELTPLGGLMLLTRDVPIVQAWLQKILFGINPQVKAEADMKNGFWKSYLSFITMSFDLQGTFRQKKAQYFRMTEGQSTAAKLAQVHKIHYALMDIMGLGRFYKNDQAEENFFTQTRPFMHFYLIGVDDMPDEVKARMKNENNSSSDIGSFFENWWTRNASAQNGQFTGIFARPDDIILEMEHRVQRLIDEAQILANAFFSQWMVVDPVKLITEANTGPGVTPAMALVNMSRYLSSLERKFKERAEKISTNAEDTWGVQSALILIDDTQTRIKRILTELDPKTSSMRTNKIKEDMSPDALNKRKHSEYFSKYKENAEAIMSMLYEAAALLISRDSFFTARMEVFLRADMADSIASHQGMTERQKEYLKILGPGVVNQLAQLFTGSQPVLKRDDISVAKTLHITTLKEVEKTFSRVLFRQILDIDAKIYGGHFAEVKHADSLDPAEEYIAADGRPTRGPISQLNVKLADARESGNKPGIWGWWAGGSTKPTEDSPSYQRLRAKLCMQALAFESRELFKEICHGAIMTSEFSDGEDKLGLNMSFDKALSDIQNSLKSKNSSRIDAAREIGVCSLRKFFRKNQIYYLYKQFNEN